MRHPIPLALAGRGDTGSEGSIRTDLCNRKACQIRTIAVCDSPVLCAINRVLQCVLLAGIDSNVFVITSSIWLSLIDRGAPGRRFIEQPFQTSHTKSFPLFADHCSRDPEPLGYRGVARPAMAGKHDPGAHG